MKLTLVFSLILSYTVITFASDQTDLEKKIEQSRFFTLTGTGLSFTTFTVIKTSTTVTSTLTSTTSCTTSTATLTTCTVGRRRRGLFYDEAEVQGRNRKGLFYNDDEEENKDGSDFLPISTKSSPNPVGEVELKNIGESSVVPLVVEAGFATPNDITANRFLLAFGTKSVTTFVITTSTISLTAICSSTTGFPLCGNLGK